ncbi:Protein of unknown function [Gryllus bimaculatus]|nr:Protein of unknown function [Gryllus bimaculatus]
MTERQENGRSWRVEVVEINGSLRGRVEEEGLGTRVGRREDLGNVWVGRDSQFECATPERAQTGLGLGGFGTAATVQLAPVRRKSARYIYLCIHLKVLT